MLAALALSLLLAPSLAAAWTDDGGGDPGWGTGGARAPTVADVWPDILGPDRVTVHVVLANPGTAGANASVAVQVRDAGGSLLASGSRTPGPLAPGESLDVAFSFHDPGLAVAYDHALVSLG